MDVPLWGWALYGLVLVVIGNLYHDEILQWVARHMPNLSFLDSIGSALAFIIAAQISSNRDANYARLQLISNLRRVSLAFLRSLPSNQMEEGKHVIRASQRFVFDAKWDAGYVDVRDGILKGRTPVDRTVLERFAEDCDSIYYSLRNLRFRSFSNGARLFQTVLMAVYIGFLVVLFHAQNTIGIAIVTTQLFIGAFVGLQQITAAPNAGTSDKRFQRELQLAFAFVESNNIMIYNPLTIGG